MRASDEYFMGLALENARLSGFKGEVPVGAVIVKDDKVIAKGFNRREFGKNALYHAELDAIDNACKTLGGWRLCNCEMYVSLEPCPMCAGAIINSRIKRVVFGAYDNKAGACGSVINLFDYQFNHKPQVTGGILEHECSELLSLFFKKLRERK